MKEFTYFAVADNGTPVEVDAELALSLYQATKTEYNDDKEINVEINMQKAREAFETGEQANIDEGTYIYGTRLSEKERFKMALRDGIQSTEEFREKRKQGC
jgi:hypothetical protein